MTYFVYKITITKLVPFIFQLNLVQQDLDRKTEYLVSQEKLLDSIEFVLDQAR